MKKETTVFDFSRNYNNRGFTPCCSPLNNIAILPYLLDLKNQTGCPKSIY